MRRLLAAAAAGFWLAAASMASADEPYKWEGFYVGVQGGGDWGTTKVVDPYGGNISDGEINTNGFFGGLEAGYNFQSFANPVWVVGIEGDLDFADTDGTTTCNAVFTNVISANCRSSQDFFATLTARVGHAWGAEGRTLTYLKAGGALVHNDIKITNNESSPYFFPPTTSSDTDFGWTIGIGLEQALTPAWSLKAEYDYLHFNGSMRTPDTVAPGIPISLSGRTTSVRETFGLVKLGLNYKLGEDPSLGWGGGLLGDDGMHGVPAGWSFESGMRYWASSGKFQWDVGLLPPNSVVNDTLISRLTYRGLTAHSAELFENIETPWNIFAKATIGIGAVVDGEDNDEDWNFGGSDAYSNTISHDRDGHLSYANVDLGYNFLTGESFKIGAFAGFSYFEERWDSFGCIQIADPNLGCSPAFPDNIIVGTENVRWDALRLGFNGSMRLSNDLTFNANLAYLPYAEFTGRDNHLLRTFSFFIDQAGSGEGVQLEGSLDYKVSNRFSLGLGGRYWAWWTRDGAGDMDAGGPGGPSIFFLGDRYDTNRWGGFFQAAYHYDAKDDGESFAWADNGATNDGRWAGFYVGLHTGAGWGLSTIDDSAGSPIFGNDVTISSALAGIQAGYNWQSPSEPTLVFGIEAEASFASSDGTRTCLASTGTFISANCESDPTSMGTVTARIGRLFGSSGRTLLYGKGGLAWIQNDVVVATNNLGSPNVYSREFDLGWTLGLGAEQALTQGLAVKLEYEYMGFGSNDLISPISGDYNCNCFVNGHAMSYDTQMQLLQVGLNYKIGADPLAAWDGMGIPFHAAPAGWSFEFGTRAWASLGKFQWDHGVPPPSGSLISRLTYDNMVGYTGELFERLDTPWNFFLKGNVGVGALPQGKMNDEDWNIGVGYSNTISHEDSGRISYATADLGYDVLTGPDYKLGLFFGYNFLAERIDSRGCIQIAGAVGLCDPVFPDLFIVGTQNVYWHSWRVGFAGETRLFDNLKLKTDIAYLPWSELSGGRDNHLLRTTTTFINQKGTGEGVQLEGSLDYMFTDAFSVGIGGRYWTMWTHEGYDQVGLGGGAFTPWFQGEKFSTDRYGAFLQASFKFGESAPVDAAPTQASAAAPSLK
ncbi:MAG: outer membrane beta-barrel protein [Alphaproteobacteria bacterium]|nr:outer membrane beta-barrel protein [Alphaproteobacteria bacterium]